MEFIIKTTIKAPAKKIYSSWLNSIGHSDMTGGEASITNQIEGSFTAWDGYISGKNKILEPYKRIVQSWRTTEFSDDESDSELEIILNEKDGITEITLIHRNLPDHGGQYEQGWENHYFDPMKAYFESG